jgi:hypothetical protein
MEIDLCEIRETFTDKAEVLKLVYIILNHAIFTFESLDGLMEDLIDSYRPVCAKIMTAMFFEDWSSDKFSISHVFNGDKIVFKIPLIFDILSGLRLTRDHTIFIFCNIEADSCSTRIEYSKLLEHVKHTLVIPVITPQKPAGAFNQEVVRYANTVISTLISQEESQYVFLLPVKSGVEHVVMYCTIIDENGKQLLTCDPDTFVLCNPYILNFRTSFIQSHDVYPYSASERQSPSKLFEAGEVVFPNIVWLNIVRHLHSTEDAKNLFSTCKRLFNLGFTSHLFRKAIYDRFPWFKLEFSTAYLESGDLTIDSIKFKQPIHEKAQILFVQPDTLSVILSDKVLIKKR